MRLDLALVARGLMESRARAQAAIKMGLVHINGEACTNAHRKIADTDTLTADQPWPFVSRAALKLAHALAAWPIEVTGKYCLDIGASTGGFCEILLNAGATHVTGVDVGSAQLHTRLQGVARLTYLEGQDVRNLAASQLSAPPQILTSDLSFISVLKAIDAPLALMAPCADCVILIKPQFELSPSEVGKGAIVPKERALSRAQEVAAELDGKQGFALQAMIESPLQGGDGNHEYLAWLKRTAA